METPAEEHTIYEFFLISVLLKGLISVVEVVAGVFIFFIPSAMFLALVNQLVAFVPDGTLSTALLAEVAKYTSSTAQFFAFYLLSRGLVKVFLIWALLKNKLWAYPASLGVLSLFVLYQLYQIVVDHSILVMGITVFDLVVMYFIWREYRIVQTHRALQSPRT